MATRRSGPASLDEIQTPDDDTQCQLPNARPTKPPMARERWDSDGCNNSYDMSHFEFDSLKLISNSMGCWLLVMEQEHWLQHRNDHWSLKEWKRPEHDAGSGRNCWQSDRDRRRDAANPHILISDAISLSWTRFAMKQRIISTRCKLSQISNENEAERRLRS